MEVTLAYAKEAPPLAIIATAALLGVPLKTDPKLPSGSPPSFSFPSGEELHGACVLLRYLGRVASLPDFYNRDALSIAQIDEWLEYAPIFSSGAEFEGACAYVDDHLSLRTFLVGYNLSVADIAIWSGIAGTGQRWESIRKSKKYQNLVRWFNSILSEYSTLSELVQKYVGRRGIGNPGPANLKESKLNGHKGESSEKEKQEGSFDIDLPDAEVGKVCTRFPPEPSGFLHIGHAKAAFLNQFFAQKYEGRLIIRFDDTNPAKESNEFVENILNDLDTLGIKGEGPTYTSDYFPQLLEMAEKMIFEGKAYVDDTPREQMQKERMDGTESINRNNSVEKNMALWKEMIAGTERGLQCCLRGKLDMQAANKSLRDPVYYRCNPVSHHRVGSKYKVYPTYDFACPFVDSIEGVTHALRSSEYHDRNEQYYMVLKDMGLRKVHVWDFSRLNFVYTLLSKRKLQWFVDHGKVEGWDDPRFPTVQGILRRGLTVEALKQFILSQGASKNLNLMEWDKLWTINKKIIDHVCPRHTAVFENGRVLLSLTNGPEEPFVKIVPRHKKYEGAGMKATTFTKSIWLDGADAASMAEGEEVTLMDWGNAIIEHVEKDESGAVIHLSGVLHLEGSVKTTKLKLTWLPEISELVNLSLVEVDHLITKKKLEETDNFLEVLNPCTRWETAAVGDANMRNLKKDEIIQLERRGYFRCDVPYLRPSKPVVLIAIPDGRQQSVLKAPGS
uniref:glutamate--tRNA ligase n=1 Tax=Wollemia nobilis TaxID=56998 RepID=A0A0C9RN52_9CONI